MTRFFLECTIRAALIVGATALVLYVMRVRVASVKHRVWTAVLLLMLALPLWIAWGPKAPIRILPATVENFTTDVFVTTPATAVSNLPKSDLQRANVPSRGPTFSTTEALLLGLYLFGTLIFLVRLAIGTWKAHRLVRESSSFEFFYAQEALASGNGMPSTNKKKSPHPEGREATRRISLGFASRTAERTIAASNRPHRIRISAACAAPVTVGCFHPTILLPENWREWSASQLAAVLAHEREHARRHDPLIQWLALFNRAVFWFHPAAWWLERELSALAEECCDTAVLAQGHDPAAYAETLMHMARAIMHSGARVNATGTAMPGPRLPHRVRSIIDARSSVRMPPSHAASIIGICAVTCVASLAVTLTHAQSSGAQGWEKAAGGKISFDVASVKQNTSGRGARPNFPLDDTDSYSGDTTLLSATALPLTSYIGFAYKLPAFEQRKMETQLPQWARTERFDIEARAATPSTKDQMRLMMQSLLKNRFKWKAHFETHEEPIFLLVFAKPGQTGPQLRPNSDDPPCSAGPPPSGPTAPGLKMDVGEFPPMCNVVMGFRRYMNGASLTTWGARNISMKQLANDIAVAPTANMDRPVVDATGLAGNFDFVMNFGEPTPVEPNVAPVDSGPTFLEALKEQLGLKLQSGTGPVDSLIVDHIEEPTPN